MEHLDMDTQLSHANYEEMWDQAVAELRNINTYKAAKDKMTCIINASKIITRILCESVCNVTAPGADDYLPALIWALIQANPHCLMSNIDYIASFRSPDKLMSENGYFFMSLQGAASFILNVTCEQLSISHKDFNLGMAAATCSANSGGYNSVPSLQSVSSICRNGTDDINNDFKQKGSDNSPVKVFLIDQCSQGESVRVPLMPPLEPPLLMTVGSGGSLDDRLSVREGRASECRVAMERTKWMMDRLKYFNATFDDLTLADIEGLLKEYNLLARSCDMLLEERRSMVRKLEDADRAVKDITKSLFVGTNDIILEGIW